MNAVFIYAALFFPVMISGLVVFAFHFTEKKLKLILSFSAAYILSLVFLHLLPELYASINATTAGVYILFGFFVQLLLEFFSTGIEHGHVHVHSHEKKIPLSVLFGLFFHSMLEGMPVASTHSISADGTTHYLNSLVLGIVLHNIPISIAFTGMLLHLGFSKSKAFVFLILFALMAPLGSFVSHILQWFDYNGFDEFMNIALGIVIGIFLHISTTIMFESSEKNHRYHVSKIIAIVSGAAIAWLLIR